MPKPILSQLRVHTGVTDRHSVWTKRWMGMCMWELELYNTSVAAQVAVLMVAGCFDRYTCAVQMQLTVQMQQEIQFLLLLWDENVELEQKACFETTHGWCFFFSFGKLNLVFHWVLWKKHVVSSFWVNVSWIWNTVEAFQSNFFYCWSTTNIFMLLHRIRPGAEIPDRYSKTKINKREKKTLKLLRSLCCSLVEISLHPKTLCNLETHRECDPKCQHSSHSPSS